MKPRILALLLVLLLLCGCAAPQKAPAEQPAPEQPAAIVTWDSLTFDRALPLSYAEQFTVSYAGEDYTRITIGEDQTFLLVAAGPGGRAGGRDRPAAAAGPYLSRRHGGDGLFPGA